MGISPAPIVCVKEAGSQEVVVNVVAG